MDHEPQVDPVALLKRVEALEKLAGVKPEEDEKPADPGPAAGQPAA